ncbi:hypothetical protein MTO96_037789 [Rhipicephalus appendiculatus]
MAAKITYDQAREDTICPNKMQNIIVISTPHQNNAAAYVKVQKLHTNQGAFEVAAYVAAPDNTCKGVIKNVDLSFDDATLKRLIVHDRNPTAIEARRSKKTKVVAILFDGLRVPSTVMCGTAMVPCPALQTTSRRLQNMRRRWSSRRCLPVHKRNEPEM